MRLGPFAPNWIGPAKKPTYRIFQIAAMPPSGPWDMSLGMIALWRPMISRPMAPITRTGRRTNPAMRIMLQPMTQITPAISYPAKSKLNVQATRRNVSSSSTSQAPRVNRNRERSACFRP
jgi:hypothetical protein